MAIKTISLDELTDEPMVVIPLRQWKKIEQELEGIEMLQSGALVQYIAKERKEKKMYSSKEVKKKLGL